MFKNKIILAFLAITLLFSSQTLAQKRKPAKPNNPDPPAAPAPPAKPAEPETIKPPETPLSVEEMEKLTAIMETDKGNITIEFYPKSAPNHVRQFVWLARIGYFDGMTVSRVIPKFIIQSGNPSSWDESNPNKKKRFDIPKLKAEYDANVKHERGALSMARPSNDPDGGTTHFFICSQKASSLDNGYSIFGHVVNGIEVVDTIAASPIEQGTQDKPAEHIEVKHVLIKELLKEVEKPKETESKPQ